MSNQITGDSIVIQGVKCERPEPTDPIEVDYWKSRAQALEKEGRTKSAIILLRTMDGDRLIGFQICGINELLKDTPK